jgi:uncharacterized membrane protein
MLKWSYEVVNGGHCLFMLKRPHSRWLLWLALLPMSCDAPVSVSDSLDTGAYLDLGCDQRDFVTWESGGEQFFLENCRSCHSEHAVSGSGAPSYLTYDTPQDVWAARFNIRQAALWDRYMPPALPLSEEGAQLLTGLLDCGLR